MQSIFSAHGHTVKYVVLPWKRALADVESGAIDCAVGVIREEAPGLIFPNEAVGSLEVGFFTVQSGWKYTGKKSLDGMVFGIADGYSYGERLDKMIARGDVRTEVLSGCTPLDANMDKLRYGRIHGIIADRTVFNYMAAQKGLSHLFHYGGSVGGVTPLYVAFTPKRGASELFAEILSDGIIKLRKSGELTRILSKYGLSDWK